jgi:plastocyanin
MRRLLPVGALVGLALVVGFRPATAAERSVTIAGFSFDPQRVRVDAGDTVAWTNRDPVLHSVTADDGSFDRDVPSDTTTRIRFSGDGTIAYHCKYHPSMRGEVAVAPAGATTAPTTTAAVTTTTAPTATTARPVTTTSRTPATTTSSSSTTTTAAPATTASPTTGVPPTLARTTTTPEGSAAAAGDGGGGSGGATAALLGATVAVAIGAAATAATIVRRRRAGTVHRG